jgi:hypothetical protein
MVATMAKHKKHHIIAGILTVFAAFFAITPLFLSSQVVSASAASQLYITPASGTTTAGGNITLNIYVNTNGNSINTAQTVVSWSSAHYSYVGISNGSSFGTFPNTPGSSSVSFAAGSTAPVTGNVLVATLTLHATAAGSSQVTLANVCAPSDYSNTCSATYDSATSNNDLASVVGGNYVVAAAQTGGSGGGSSGGTPSGGGGSGSTGYGSGSGSTSHSSSTSSSGAQTTTTPSTTPTATATPSNPAPTISDIKVTNVSTNTATVTWTTNIASTSVVNFGLDSTYGLTASDTNLVTNHSVDLGSTYLSQGNTYYFTVTSATSTGVSATSDQSQFSTTGFNVTIVVNDKAGQPIKGAIVIINGVSETTNSQGVATFTNVKSGLQTVSIKSGTKLTAEKITVGQFTSKTGGYQPQKFTVTATTGAAYTVYYLTAGVLILIALLVILGSHNPRVYETFDKLFKKKNEFATEPTGPSMPDSTISPLPTTVSPVGHVISPSSPDDEMPKDSETTPTISIEPPKTIETTQPEAPKTTGTEPTVITPNADSDEKKQ